MALSSIEDIIQDIRAGKMVILMDDEDRENEGDIIIASECVTAEHINFMARHARGLPAFLARALEPGAGSRPIGALCALAAEPA